MDAAGGPVLLTALGPRLSIADLDGIPDRNQLPVSSDGTGADETDTTGSLIFTPVHWDLHAGVRRCGQDVSRSGTSFIDESVTLID